MLFATKTLSIGYEMNVLVTGCAGFIGYHVTKSLCEQGHEVVGIDNLNDYYDIRLKHHRLELLHQHKNFLFVKEDIEDYLSLSDMFKLYRFDTVINLAARAGVRYSLENPFIYASTNTMGTLNLLECCKKYNAKKFVLASTSSLYAGQKTPFKESLAVNKPISPYAASKKGAEAFSYTYHYLFGIDVTVVRYFTVYGPMGRPDMSIFRFIRWVDEGTPIELFGDGTQERDFTYVDDIARGTIAASETKCGYEVINLGGNQVHSLNYAISLIEKYLGKKAKRDLRPFHKADLMVTCADITKAQTLLGWNPTVSLEEGIKKSVEWYLKCKTLAKVIKL